MAAPKRGPGRPRKEHTIPGPPPIIHTTTEIAEEANHPEDWKENFLNALRKKPNVTHACKVAKTTRRVAYYHRNSEPEFLLEWDMAIEEGRDIIETMMIDAAMGGDYKSREFLLHKWRYSSSILKSRTDHKEDDPKTITVQWGN